jgi:hypothetical protein
MTNSDAIVAEVIEPKPDLPSEEKVGEMLMGFISGAHFYSLGRAWKTVFVYEHGDVAELEPVPFISAPTAETDWIVLEWVQGQDVGYSKLIAEKLLELIWGGIPQHEVAEQLDEFVRFYRPGDYARALLAVTKEARGE